MNRLFGRFEVHSELSKSGTALIYKALDVRSNQIVALKTQGLARLGERAEAYVAALLAEGERAHVLTGHGQAEQNQAGQNFVSLYDASEGDRQFFACMEYIQGNSVAAMLARRESFSIWDLLDITRQVCAALQHADASGVVHSSLEPTKVMVQWDGLVRILGYGISRMGLIEAEVEGGDGLGRLMPYCSPEQLRGEDLDLRSNLFTLGAILYEMAAGRKAFDAEDPVALLHQIEYEMPPEPAVVNAKTHPGLSAAIMKALAKNPGERYRSARELADAIEQCKGGREKSAEDGKKSPQGPKLVADASARAAATSKFVSAGAAGGHLPAPAPAARATIAGIARLDAPRPPAKAFAAAAGAGTATSNRQDTTPMSRVSVDPMMAAAETETETETTVSRKSFSEMEELPPLSEVTYMPPPQEPVLRITEATAQAVVRGESGPRKSDKPAPRTREVAQEAMREIATVPPKLMLWSILGAMALISAVALGIFFHVHSEDDGSTAAPRPVSGEVIASTSSAPVAPAQAVESGAAETGGPVAPSVATDLAINRNIDSKSTDSKNIDSKIDPIQDPQPVLTVRPAEPHAVRGKRHATAALAVAAIPGQALIDSTPRGAPFQVDGKSDPSWVTPFTVASLPPGKHLISINKSGYSSEVRSVEVSAGNRASVVFHLAPMNALVVVNSAPAGAAIMLDGKDSGRVTPAQFAVERGSHTVMLRKQGYLDETVAADLGPGQNFQYAPALRALGSVEDMRTVGKLNKIFGHGGDSVAGMGTIAVHTQPKGAQVAINQRVLDKMAPVEVLLGPGNYVVDLTMTGFRPVRKIVNLEKSGKIGIDEILERQ